jgi:hypothetical protein
MAQNNRAVFEIPDMLAGIMGETETENPEKSQAVAGS